MFKVVLLLLLLLLWLFFRFFCRLIVWCVIFPTYMASLLWPLCFRAIMKGTVLSVLVASWFLSGVVHSDKVTRFFFFETRLPTTQILNNC